MAHPQINQFYTIVKQMADIFCPGKKYEDIELLNREKGIQVINDDGTVYRFTYSKNKIKVYVWKDEQKLAELSYVLGSISTKDLVDRVREALKPQGPFAALLVKNQT